ncbi:hypothetical protein ACFYQQ_31830 [Streptomyces sp. NPDC005496]|uniref:hypothetical protein n=1 Tax=unclassified Streptomyces TaxID=2593676 RepID=UPI0033A35921
MIEHVPVFLALLPPLLVADAESSFVLFAGRDVLVTVTVGPGFALAVLVTVTAGSGAAVTDRVAVTVALGLAAAFAVSGFSPAAPNMPPSSSRPAPDAHTRLRLRSGRVSGRFGGVEGGMGPDGPYGLLMIPPGMRRGW